jgi:ribosomal-protein-alanine N-acetyltransferase
MKASAVERVAVLRARLRDAPLRTERLVLRLPHAADAGLTYHGYARDAEAIRWMGFKPHTEIATTEIVMASWLSHWERGAGALLFVIEHASDGRFLGIIDLDIGGHGGLIGYVLCRPAWGQGFATEAAQCVVDLAFEHFGAWRVWATCAPQNPASRHVLEKVGMRHEGVLRRWIVSPLVSPEPRDSDCMAITRDDWLAQRATPPIFD